MRILFITHDFPPDVGGIQTYMKEYADRFAKKCDDFAVICPDKPNASAVDKKLNYPVYRISLYNNTHLYFSLRRKLKEIVQAHKSDATFHAQWHTVLAAAKLRDQGELGNVFCATHGRELLFNPFKKIPLLNSVYSRWMNRSLQAVDHHFPVSHYTKSLLGGRSIAPSQTTVHPNGTSSDDFFPKDCSDFKKELGIEGKTVLLTVARILKSKGFENVFHAVKELQSRGHNIHYLIVGDGPDRQEMESAAVKLNIENQVTFVGKVPHEQLNPYYNISDIFVLTPSIFEAFGIVYLEAGACRKPVIGSNAYGIPDAVLDGETGLLVQPDDKEELTGAVERLLQNRSLAEKLGENGYNRVKNELNWDALSNKLYSEINSRLKEE